MFDLKALLKRNPTKLVTKLQEAAGPAPDQGTINLRLVQLIEELQDVVAEQAELIKVIASNCGLKMLTAEDVAKMLARSDEVAAANVRDRLLQTRGPAAANAPAVNVVVYVDDEVPAAKSAGQTCTGPCGERYPYAEARADGSAFVCRGCQA